MSLRELSSGRTSPLVGMTRFGQGCEIDDVLRDVCRSGETIESLPSRKAFVEMDQDRFDLSPFSLE
jgi:hypothetical protein